MATQLPHDAEKPHDTAQNEATVEDGYKPEDHKTLQIRQSDKSLKHIIRCLRFITRTASVGLALYTITTMSRTLKTYLTTSNTQHVPPGSSVPRGPWAKKTSLWPTILLLAISLISLLFGTITLLTYFRSVEAANRRAAVGTKFGRLVTVGHVMIWVVVAILYRTGKTGDDLWGWACSPLAEKIQPGFDGVVDFKNVCKSNTNSWYASIANAAILIIGVVVWVLEYKRMKYREIVRQRAAVSPPIQQPKQKAPPAKETSATLSFLNKSKAFGQKVWNFI